MFLDDQLTSIPNSSIPNSSIPPYCLISDESGYIRFISLLLRSPASSSTLKSSICRQVLQAAGMSGDKKSSALSAKQQVYHSERHSIIFSSNLFKSFYLISI